MTIAAPGGPARGLRVRLAGVAAPLAIGLAFAAAWVLLHPPVPLEPTADLYEHLGVARHLVRGEGFLCDFAYPLSFAFPFAAHVPQPLIHRPPGYPLLLTLPLLAARRDPAGAVVAAQAMHVALLALIAAAGGRAARRRRRTDAIAPWLVLLLASPLLAMTVGWAQVETPAALLLALLWWRVRGDDDDACAPAAAARRGALDGALAAAVALLRADLAWTPWLWLAARGRLRQRSAALAAVAVWLLLLAPWGVRNARLAGDPFFSLQSYGEAIKETPVSPGLAVYRGLEPRPFWRTLREQPGVMLHKTAAGVRFYAVNARRWLPWPLWLAAGLLMARRGAPGARRRWPPLALLCGTVALLGLQYAVFSHALRYLAVVLPALAWEICLGVAAWLAGRRAAWPGPARAGLLAAAAGLLLVVAPTRMPGWEAARRDAVAAQPAVARAVAAAAALPPGPLFCDNGAVPWLLSRPGVWLPDEPVLAAIRARVPELARAPVVRLNRPDAPPAP